jgi:hypothetical protein
MRLTLRTLLAYLDDTLEPGQAKLIGQKVAESDAAQELVARIKQVTRRRRLTAPPTGGPGGGLDANTIAEYLDNILTGEQLAQVEETCLASDVHLAEVAACHQILTLVLGEPALVPPTARQRMYRLVRGREAVPNRRAAAAAVGQGAVDGLVTPADEADEALLLGLPLYRRGAKWARWLVPLAVACLLVGAGVALWMALPGTPPLWELTRLTPPKQPAEAPTELKAAPAAPPPVEPKPERKEPKPEPKPAPTAPKQTVEKEKAPPPEPTKPEPTKPAAPPVPAPQPPQPVTAAPPSPERRELARAVWIPPPASVLLQRTAGTGVWQRVPLQKRVSSTDYLVSLPGYRTELRLDSGVTVTLWGNLPQFSRSPVLESGVTLYTNPSYDVDLRLGRGRIVLANRKDDGPARVRLRFLNESWDLALDKGAEAAVDLVGLCLPYMRGTSNDEPGTLVRLYGLKGQADLKARDEEHLLTAPCLFDWDTGIGSAQRPQAIPRAPDWWTNRLPPRSKQVDEMQAALAGLSQRLIDEGKKIDVVVAEMLRDNELGNRELAIRCLGVLDQLGRLVDTMGEDHRRSTDRILREVAIDELQHLLGLDAHYNGELLQSLRSKGYTEGQAQTVLQLLRGFPEQQLREPATRITLVEYLNHDKLAIRQLAYTMLLFLVRGGEKIRYDPAGDAAQRERGAREWLKLVRSNGAQPPSRPGTRL